MSPSKKRPRQSGRMRIGNVSLYEHHGSYWIYFRENGSAQRRLVGKDLDAANAVAAQINAQLAAGQRSLFAFEPVSIQELVRRFQDHHEHVRRSSVATVRRYGTACEHLVRFAEHSRGVKHAHEVQGEAFVRYLRGIQVAPNGHAHTLKRPLRDKGIRFILGTCRALYNFAAKQHLLPPHLDNPFAAMPIDRMPVEDAKPIHVFTAAEECAFLKACDDWQLPVFYILAKVGVRSGELTHLLVEDVDFSEGTLHVRNKAELGWRVKTRNVRSSPLPD